VSASVEFAAIFRSGPGALPLARAPTYTARSLRRGVGRGVSHGGGRQMKNILKSCLLALALLPMVALAGGTINAYQTLDFDAASEDVWDAMKSFDSLHTWHPGFSNTELMSGENNQPGAWRKLTIKDGPSFEEELTEFDDGGMKLRYKIIGANELPIENYDSTIRVVSTGRKRSSVIWSSTFTAKEGNKDEDMIQMIQGIYQAGLENLRRMVE
jgi:mxaD protein